MAGEIFSNQFKVVRGKAYTDFAFVNAEYYPASGSFVDVSKAERFHVFVQFGTIHNSDTVTLTLVQHTLAGGAPTSTVSATYATITATGGQDSQMASITVETKKLTSGYKYVTLLVAGATNGSYGNIHFFVPEQSVPVSQTTSVFPTASQLAYVG